MSLFLFLSLWTGTAPVSRAAMPRPVADSLWTAGVEAYADGRWQDALSPWLAIEAGGAESAALYVNIGDAWFKSGELARAILYYERALKLDPSDADARHNLSFANGFVQDRIDAVPEFFLSSWLRRSGRALSSDGWTVLFFVLLILALAAALVFLLGRSAGARKAGFFTGLPALLLALLCLSFAARQRSVYLDGGAAIITRPVSPVKSSPGSEGGKDLFLLHEGTRVVVTDRVGDWENITLADGRQGWIMASDADLI